MSTTTPTAKYLEVLYGRTIADLLSDLYGRGLSQEQIAAQLGVSRWTVLRWMADCGIQTRDRRKSAPVELA